MSAPLRFLIALAAGALAACGFAPLGLWPLTIVAIAALIALLDLAKTRRGAFASAWWFGVGNFTAGFAWIAHAFTYQEAMPAWMGWPTVVLLSMFLALYVGLAGLIASVARDPLPRVLLFAAAWMLGEWLRGWVLSGFAWNPLGSAWLPVPVMPQAGAWLGAIGLSGAMILAGGALWLATRRHWRAAAASVAGVLAIAALGAIPRAALPTAPVMLHIVQPNIGQEDRWNPAVEASHLRLQLDLTRAALAAPGRPPALVMWSESAIQGLAEEDPVLRAQLASVLRRGDLLLFGGIAVKRDQAGEAIDARNSLFVLDSNGRLLDRYDKAHLVPLGEYVPAHDLMTAIGLARLSPGNLGFLAGPGPRTLPLPGFPAVGVQICYEMIFPAEVVDPANRPAWLLQPSNDSWYGAWMQPQHVDQARLRAIEEGLPIARATPNGISALLDAHGRVVQSIPSRVAGVISAELPPPLAPTLFAQLGHWTTAAFGLLLVLAAAWASRKRI